MLAGLCSLNVVGIAASLILWPIIFGALTEVSVILVTSDPANSQVQGTSSHTL